MTDRYKAFIVHLDKDIREDDCEEIITALRMIKRVQEVKPVLSGINDDTYYMRGRNDVIDALYKCIRNISIGTAQDG